MKVMILAAGYGKRMLPLTKTTPKPLLKVGGKTLIQRNIEALLDEGFEEFIINTSYLGSMIRDHVSEKFPSIKVNFSEEDEPLGTGGGIVKALSLIGEDSFILINADLEVSNLIVDNRPKESTNLTHLSIVDFGFFNLVQGSSLILHDSSFT